MSLRYEWDWLVNKFSLEILGQTFEMIPSLPDIENVAQ